MAGGPLTDPVPNPKILREPGLLARVSVTLVAYSYVSAASPETAYGSTTLEDVQAVLSKASEPRGSIPSLLMVANRSASTFSRCMKKLEAKQRQNVQPARSRMRCRIMSSAHCSGPWNRSPSHSTASLLPWLPSTTKSMRKPPQETWGSKRYPRLVSSSHIIRSRSDSQRSRRRRELRMALRKGSLKWRMSNPFGVFSEKAVSSTE